MSKLKSMSNFFLIEKQKIFNYFFNFKPKSNIMFKKLFLPLFSIFFLILGCDSRKKVITVSSILISTYDNTIPNKDSTFINELKQLDKQIVSSLPFNFETIDCPTCACIRCKFENINIDSLIDVDTINPTDTNMIDPTKLSHFVVHDNIYKFPKGLRDSTVEMCCAPPSFDNFQNQLVSNTNMNVSFYKNGKKLEVAKTIIAKEKDLFSHQLDKNNYPDIIIIKYKEKKYAIRFQNQSN